MVTAPRMTTPQPSYTFYHLPEGRNPERDSCMNCGWKYPTNPHKNSFYCPNPSCRLPHVCIRPGRRDILTSLPDPTDRSMICYNCKNAIFEIQPIPRAHVKRPNVCPPSFRCPNCLFLYYYYRPFFTDQVVDGIHSSPRPIYYKKDIDDHESSCCAICTDSLFMNESSRAYYLQPCGHGFHKDCILEWLNSGSKTTCPLCRQKCFEYVRRVCSDGVSLWDAFELYLMVKEVVSGSARRENSRAMATAATAGLSNDHSRACDGKIGFDDDDGDTLMVDASN